MPTKRSFKRPVKFGRRDENMILRLGEEEKEAFRDAANLSGIPLSAWVRERLRQAAVRELEAAARPIAFLRHL